MKAPILRILLNKTTLPDEVRQELEQIIIQAGEGDLSEEARLRALVLLQDQFDKEKEIQDAYVTQVEGLDVALDALKTMHKEIEP